MPYGFTAGAGTRGRGVATMHTWQMFSLMTLVLWGTWGILGKLSTNQGTSPMLVAMLSSLGALAVVALVQLIARLPLHQPPLGLTYALLAGAVGGLGAILFFYALRDGKVSVVLPISACYPVLTILMAVLLLKEEVSLVQGLGIAFAVTGVLLLSL